VPRPTLRRLVGHQRTRRANRQLGLLLGAALLLAGLAEVPIPDDLQPG